MSEVPAPGAPRGRLARVGHLVWRALKLEIFGYWSIGRFIARRNGVPPGGKGFSYHRVSVAPLTAFLALSILELIAVDLLVRRWPSVRITMLILGLWGLVYMFGLLFGMLTHPHVVTSDSLQLKQGPEVTVRIDWECIDKVAKHRSTTSGEKAHKVTQDPEGRTILNLWACNESNLVIDLETPQSFQMPGRSVRADRVRFYVDDPSGFMDAIRPILVPPRHATDEPSS